MMLPRTRSWMLASVVSLSIVASGCNKQPVQTVSSHPPATDLTCPAEPAAPTDADVMADLYGQTESKFLLDVILAGRGCRDALMRVCLWHKERGTQIDCTAVEPR